MAGKEEERESWQGGGVSSSCRAPPVCAPVWGC